MFTFSSIKQKSIKLLSTIRSLFCDNLVYQVEKSKVETEVAFLRLLSPFIASMAGLLYPKRVTEKKLCLTLYVCNCLKKKQKIDVLAG